MSVNKLNFSKKNRIFQVVKVLLPPLLFFGGVGTGIFYIHRALNAGNNSYFNELHDLSKQPLHKNEYQSRQDINEKGFKTLKKPHWSRRQSIQVQENPSYKYTPKTTNNKNQYIFNNLNQNNIQQSLEVFTLDMTNDKFLNVFQERLDPSINFDFDLIVENNHQEKVIKNCAFGFDINDFVRVKDNTYDVFEYDLDQESTFQNLGVKIKGKLKASINRQNNFQIKFSIVGEKTNKNASLVDPEIKVTFKKPTTSVNNTKAGQQKNAKQNAIFDIFVLWDADAINNYQSWFWPAPDGPVNNPKIIIPDETGLLIDESKYKKTTASLDQIKEPDKYLSMNYQPVNKTQKNNINSAFCKKPLPSRTGTCIPEINTENIYDIEISKENWRQIFYQDLGDDVTNPALKAQFNMEFAVMDAFEGQLQRYKSTFYGIFDALKISNGSNFSQTIVDYDLQKGRQFNGGHFKLELQVQHLLNNSLKIKINAIGQRLYFFKRSGGVLTQIADSSYKIDYKPSDFRLVGYKNKTNQLPSKTEIIPQTQFGKRHRYSSTATSFIENINVKNPMGIKENSSPPLFLLPENNSSWQELDITDITENNKQNALNALLTFNFRSIYSIGSLNFLPYNKDWKIENFVVYNPGYYFTDLAFHTYFPLYYIKKVFNYKTSSDIFNKFTIPVRTVYDFLNNVNNSTKEYAHYTWRSMFSFNSSVVIDKNQKNPYDEYEHWKRDIFDNENISKHDYYEDGAHVKFIIQIKFEKNKNVINPKKIFYRLNTQAKTFQRDMSWINRSGTGRAGFGIKEIDVFIKPNN